MKKIFSLIIPLSCLLIQSFAQREDLNNRKMNDQETGSLLYIVQYNDVKGSPFLFDDWTNGEILTDNARFKNLPVKFDAYSNKFIVNRHDTAYEISPAIKEIRLYTSPDTSEMMTFKKGFSINDKINNQTFLQVLAEGKMSLLKYVRKDMEEYNEYGDATKYKRFTDYKQDYILTNGQYKSVTLSKKNLQDVLSDKWNQVSQFLTQKNLNGKDEKSWALAIQYYNSL